MTTDDGRRNLLPSSVVRRPTANGVSDGDTAARCSLRAARAGEAAGVYAGGGADVSVGHRREHGHLLGRGGRALEAAALRTARAARVDVRGRRGRAEPLGLVPELPRLARAR